MKTRRLMSRSLLFVVAALISLAPGDLRAAPLLSLDVDATDAPASETQTGFTRMTASNITGDAVNGSRSPTATVNGVTVTATAAGGFRDRTIASATVPPPPVQNVLRDFIFVDGASAEIQVSIQNLAAGAYEITTFHHDWNVAGSNPATNVFDLLVTDAMGANQLKVSDATFINSSSYSGETFSIYANGIDNILLRIIEDSASNRARFNGITITAIPEPSSMVLLGIGAVILCGYGWQRRKQLGCR